MLVFIDQSKAFDWIYHEGLKYKLKSIGLSGTLYELLCNYFENKKIRVVMDGSKSNWIKVTQVFHKVQFFKRYMPMMQYY